MQVEPGEHVAIVGPSGSGKSSLVNLLPRFWEPTSGRITIDGYDIRDLTLKSLRKQISIVSQDIVLFDGTIRQNLIYEKPDATEEEIQRAIDGAALKDFIDLLPEGLEMKVGEDGNLLSGGQKQRIAIARSMLKDAPILILDEATSSLDSNNELLIEKYISAETIPAKTVISNTHKKGVSKEHNEVVITSLRKSKYDNYPMLSKEILND